MSAAPEVAAELPTSDCSICRHPDAAAIDEALLGGTSIRTVAETHDLSRSAVGRHKLNHLSVEAITDPEPSAGRKPLRMVDVHAQLTALADRLEKVVELATRTRKAPAAIAAMRELRQVLEAIARIQADPDLRTAAGIDVLRRDVDAGVADWWVALIDFLAETAGLDLRSPVWAGIVANCLRTIVVDEDGVARHYRPANFSGVDTSHVRQEIERQALARAARVEAEVRRRVEAELRRRENQARPAIEAHERPAIEGAVPRWSA